MTTSQVPNTDQIGQFTQACPACDGTMPAEAVRTGKWLPVNNQPAGLRRMIRMVCPHCGHRERRLEIVPRASMPTEREMSEMLRAES